MENKELMENIFNKQREFQELLSVSTKTQQFKNSMILGLFSEVAEILNETPFKEHKFYQTLNKQKFLEECIDAQLYLINLILTETDFNTFIKMLEDKQKINFERIKNGY